MSANHHSTRRSTKPEPAHEPSKAEARDWAAARRGLPHAVLDAGDVGAMQAIVHDWTEAAVNDYQRDLAAEMQSYLAFLQKQFA